METDPRALVAALNKDGAVGETLKYIRSQDRPEVMQGGRGMSPEEERMLVSLMLNQTPSGRGVQGRLGVPVGNGQAFVEGGVERIKGPGVSGYGGGGRVGYEAQLSPLERLMFAISGGGADVKHPGGRFKDFNVDGAQVQYNRRF